jgi:hypothetical protein
MRQTVKAAAKWVASLGGIQLSDPRTSFVAPRTTTSCVAELIRALAPLATDHPLIRLGPEADGGYLVVDDLDGIRACFSPGVSTVSGFEEACAERGMQVFLADASVVGPAVHHPSFTFVRKYVGAFANEDFMTLDDWVINSIPPDDRSDLLLQMDIEGYEYETLLAASEPLIRRFRQIIVEFHALDQLWNRSFFQLAARAFRKLLRSHACVHIHPNNCCGSYECDGIAVPKVAEMTFVRMDRCRVTQPTTVFPHPLDRDNTDNPPLPLCWYR